MAVKKTTKKRAKGKKAAAPPDIRAHLEPSPANLSAVLTAVAGSLTNVKAPAEPASGDLVEAALHIIFARGVSCGIGQECRRRLEAAFVDRNEFRLTEAYEIENLLADLEIPKLFDRCLQARDVLAEVYDDQNAISLEFLREASVTDRNMFFQRVPAMRAEVCHFVVSLMTFEEILFSERSTLRLQQRMGLDPKSNKVNEFVVELRQMIRPFGHIPLEVGPHQKDGVPISEPALSAASSVVRLAPPSRGK